VGLRSGLLWLALVAVIAISAVAWANGRQGGGTRTGRAQVLYASGSISADPGAFRELQAMCAKFLKEFPGSQRRMTVPVRAGGSATLKCGAGEHR
jgi:hypothetical protein